MYPHTQLQPHPHMDTHTQVNQHHHPHTHTPTVVSHVSPPNGQFHLTLGPHMLCLCVHVAHPCTHTKTRCIVRRAPTMSPTHAELVHGYTKLGQHIICPWFALQTHTRTRWIVWRAQPVSPPAEAKYFHG
ncbi:hypothetical protein O181_099825 [Austropuccinia psidii MF-1]|uniref:Uncharacterized protein n=1 Tax=Austropuccinia psidii MF-1 TaxID=1389203 RepID=A0A9Q3JED2_9BASI|nr:hypothetical protein [Austropuccinia psidii MF-1]